MSDRERLEQYPSTAKQRGFEWDFMKDIETYEVWDEVQIGASGPAEQVFLIEEEDIVSFNVAMLETDSMMTDPEYARGRGGLVAHPLFFVPVGFFCVNVGMGSWIRTPGASNPGQQAEMHQPFTVGEEISVTVTHKDKWMRRSRFYLQDQWDYFNQDGVLKATWHARLLLPQTREDIRHCVAI